MATLHVLHGLPGSGKSTFAKRLVAEHKAIVLSNDDWQKVLYPAPCARPEFLEQVKRIESLQASMGLLLLSRGVDVIWDYGVWTKESRQQLVRVFSESLCNIQVYSMVCSDKIADHRALKRPTNGNPAHHLNQEALDLFRGMFEAIEESEGFEVKFVYTEQ